jgi:DNA-binding NarL/FixJ family response regulator
MSVRVVIADDHSMVREGLQALLSSVDGYEVVAQASAGTGALRETVTLRPDVLVLDIGLPDVNGIEVARRVTKAAPNVNILMLTMFDDDDSVLAAIRAGALGYVLKGAGADEIMRAIVSVAAGEAIFGPGLARRALKLISSGPAEPVFSELTPREREVLELIAAGLSNPVIATRLGLSLNTISNHISSIFAKLQVENRGEAIVRARTAGLG